MLQCLYGTLQLLTTCHYDTLQLHDNLQLQLVTPYSYDTLQLQLFMVLHLQLVTMMHYSYNLSQWYVTAMTCLKQIKKWNSLIIVYRGMQEKRQIWFWESVVLIVLSIIIYLCDHFPFLLILLSLVTLGYTQFGVSFNLFRWWTQMKAR